MMQNLRREEKIALIKQLIAEREKVAAGVTPVPERDPDVPMVPRQDYPEKQPAPSLGQIALSPVHGFNKGIVEVVDLPITAANALTSAANYFTPEGVPDIPRIGSIRDIPGVGDFLTKATARTVPKGESTVADVLRTGAEWAGPGFLVRGAKKLPDVLAGTGAVIGEQVGGETGEVVGGMMGMLSPTAASMTADALRKAEEVVNPVRAARRVPRQDEDIEHARDFLVKNLSDEGLANLRAARDRGETGTLSDLTLDPEAGAMERAIRTTSATQRERLAEIDRMREADTKALYQEQMPAADPKQAASLAKARVAGTEREILSAQQRGLTQARDVAEGKLTQIVGKEEAAKQEALSAKEAADLAEQKVKAKGDTARASEELYTQYKAWDDTLKEKVSGPAWEKFDKEPPRSIVDLKVRVWLKRKNADEVTRKGIDERYGKLLRQLDELGDASPQSMQNVLKRIKAMNNEASLKGAADDVTKEMSSISRLIDDYMVETVPSFKQAKEATVEHKTLLGEGAVEKGLRGDPEVFAGGLSWKGDKGKANLDRLSEGWQVNPALRDQTEKYLRERIWSEGISEKTVKPTEYGYALDEFPDLKRDIEAYLAAQSEAKALTAKADETAKISAADRREAESVLKKSVQTARQRGKERSAKVSKLLLSRYASKPKRTINELLKADDDNGELASLLKSAERSGGGDAFKAQVMDVIRERVTGVVDLEADGAKVLKDISRLEDNGLFTPDDVQGLLDIMKRNEGARLRSAGGQPPKQTAKAQLAADLGSTAAALGALSVMPAKHQLMLGNTIKRAFKQFIMRQDADPEVIARIEQMVRDPDILLAAMGGRIPPTKDPNELAKNMIRAILVSARAGTSLEEE